MVRYSQTVKLVKIGKEMRQQKKQDHGLISNFTLAYDINFLCRAYNKKRLTYVLVH